MDYNNVLCLSMLQLLSMGIFLFDCGDGVFNIVKSYGRRSYN